MRSDKSVSATTRFYTTEWYNLPALALETPAMRVVTVPAMGAKIVSIFDRAAGREWLLPPKDGRMQPVAYGASFTEQDMSGWDEMFPTIDACAYPTGSHAGVHLPDHGEVWSLAWQHHEHVIDVVRLSVNGHALPYRLMRDLEITGERSFRLSYEAVNTGDEPLCALWTAHPQFAADTQTRIILPDTVTQVVNVQATAELPEIEGCYSWSAVQAGEGHVLPLDRVRAADERKYRKLYVPPETAVGWAALQQGEADAWLRLSWDVSEIPYLGIWVDEGTYNPAPTAALEPSTGYYDKLSLAWDNQRVMHLPPDTPCRWSLDVEIGQGEILG